MRGYMGTAPRLEAIEATMSEAFGLPLDALRTHTQAWLEATLSERAAS
jgi:hypothetical protein